MHKANRSVQRANGPIRRWLGLALGVLVVMVLPLYDTPHPAPIDIVKEESFFSGVRTTLLPGARVGWLVPSEPSFALLTAMVAGRYALLPRSVRSVQSSDCIQHGGQACGASNLDYLIVYQQPGTNLAEQAMQLGFSARPGGAPTIQFAHRIR